MMNYSVLSYLTKWNDTPIPYSGVLDRSYFSSHLTDAHVSVRVQLSRRKDGCVCHSARAVVNS